MTPEPVRQFQIVLQAPPDTPDPERRLAMALKYALRAHGFKCLLCAQSQLGQAQTTETPSVFLLRAQSLENLFTIVERSEADRNTSVSRLVCSHPMQTGRNCGLRVKHSRLELRTKNSFGTSFPFRTMQQSLKHLSTIVDRSEADRFPPALLWCVLPVAGTEHLDTIVARSEADRRFAHEPS
jgi:hypothetical protein